MEYCRSKNSLTGLVSPIDNSSGFPKPNFFEVGNAQDIAHFIANYPIASYVQVIVGVPNVPNAPSFVLAYFGTDNKFLTTEVMTRNQYMKKELEKRGVKVIGTSSDGDSRQLNALKLFMNFGTLVKIGSLNLLANPFADNIGNIDSLHKAKGLVDRLYNLGIMMKLGTRCPSVNHLIMIYKKSEKIDHEMTLKDLDTTDHLNYS